MAGVKLSPSLVSTAPHVDGPGEVGSCCSLPPLCLIAFLFLLPTLFLIPSLMGSLGSSIFSLFMVEKIQLSQLLLSNLHNWLLQGAGKNQGPPSGTVCSPYKAGEFKIASFPPLSFSVRILVSHGWITNSLQAGPCCPGLCDVHCT